MATGYQHFKTHLMIGTESDYGTEVATTTKIGTVKSVQPRNSWDLMEVRGLGDGREPQAYLRTRYNAGLSVTVELHDFTVLRHAVGPLSGDGSVGTPYKITEADQTGTATATTIVPFSAEIGSDASTDDVDTYTGCLISDFSLNFSIGQPVSLSFNAVAQGVTSSTSATAYTAPTTHPFVMTSGSFKWGSSETELTQIRSASISYNNNLIVYGQWGSPLIRMPETGPREIRWNATVVMSQAVATAVRDEFYGQSNTPVTDAGDMDYDSDNELHIVLDEGSGSGDRDAEIFLDHCVIEYISKPIDFGNSDLVLMTFSGRAATSGDSDETNVFVEWWTN